MVVGFGQILLVAIVIFGLHGFIRGVRAVALTTGAIFFAVVVVVLSGDLLMRVVRDFGLVLTTLDTRALFNTILFIFTVFVASRVLVRVGAVAKAQTRAQRLWGFLLGLVNGFLIMAVIEHFLNDIVQATGGRSKVSVGVPALNFSHPTPSTWSLTLTPSTFTLLPTATSDLWTKLPVALLLLLLFLAFVFAGTIYGRLSGRSS